MSKSEIGILMSKRAHVFYHEHVKIILKDGVVTFLTRHLDGSGSGFNIPDKNTAFVLLGEGSSITSSAMAKLAESNVVVMFTGSYGSPCNSTLDHMCYTPSIIEKPSKYIQAYLTKWIDQDIRLEMAKQIFLERIRITQEAWDDDVKLEDLYPNTGVLIHNIKKAKDITELMGYEGAYTKQLYHIIATLYKLPSFKRVHDIKHKSKTFTAEKVNMFLNYGHNMAYGYTAVVLNSLGLNHGLPLIHGLTRREALIYDISDLVKDAYIMPLAFNYAKSTDDITFRESLATHFYKKNVMDIMFDSVKKILC